LAKCTYTYEGYVYESEEVEVSGLVSEGDEVYLYINPKKPTEAMRRKTKMFVISGLCIVVPASSLVMFLSLDLLFSSVNNSAGSLKNTSKYQMDSSGNYNLSKEDAEELHNKIFDENASNNNNYYGKTKINTSKFVKIKYYGATISVPDTYTAPIFPNNDKKKGYFILEDKKTGVRKCKVKVEPFKSELDYTEDIAMDQMAENLEGKYPFAYEHLYRCRESDKDIVMYVDKGEIDDRPIYIAYWIYKNRFITIEHYGTFDEAKIIGVKSMADA
jgi:hypothetical protein